MPGFFFGLLTIKGVFPEHSVLNLRRIFVITFLGDIQVFAKTNKNVYVVFRTASDLGRSQIITLCTQ